jgi:hypothetical protein
MMRMRMRNVKSMDSTTPRHQQIYGTLKTFYVIEQVGVDYASRFMTNIGKLPFTGDWTDTKEPTFGQFINVYKFPTYRSATHRLALWSMPGTYRVMYVDEDSNMHSCESGPKNPKDFTERDWKEFHEENGKSN